MIGLENIFEEKEPEIFNKELHDLMNTSLPLARGSFSEVSFFTYEQILSALDISEEEAENPILKDKLSALLLLVAKKASENEYIQPAFSGKEPNCFSKARLNDAFSSVGMPISPSLEKTKKDILESMIPLLYLGYHCPVGIDVVNLIKELRNDNLKVDDFKTDKALITAKGEEIPIFDFLNENKWVIKNAFEAYQDRKVPLLSFDYNKISSFEELNDMQDAIRRKPLNDEMKKNLKEFFESQMVVGVQTALLKIKEKLRRFHPHCGYEKAEDIIKKSFFEYGNTNFIPAETNYYGLDSHCSLEKYEKITEQNKQVVEVLADHLTNSLSSELNAKYPKEEISVLTEKVLQYYHDYPKYEQSKSVSILSITMLKTLYRIIYHAIGHNLGLPYKEKRNKNIEPLVNELTEEKDSEEIFLKLSEILKKYEKENGVERLGEKIEFQRLPLVSYTFQEKANSVFEGEEIVATLNLADLRNKENWHYFEEFPDLPKKLLVFATLVYRQFSDTGYIPDLRPPNNTVAKTLLFGIYGYETDNVVITLKKNKISENESIVKLIDNKDQMKKKVLPFDLEDPPGLAKTAFGVANMIGETALQIFIGRLVGIIIHNEENGSDGEVPLFPDEKIAKIFFDIVNQTHNRVYALLRTLFQDLSVDLKRRKKEIVARICAKIKKCFKK